MIDNHFGHVSDGKPQSCCAVAPVTIFGKFDAGKWTNGIKDFASHGEIASSGVPLTPNILLLTEAVNAFISLDHGRASRVTPHNANIAPNYLCVAVAYERS